MRGGPSLTWAWPQSRAQSLARWSLWDPYRLLLTGRLVMVISASQVLSRLTRQLGQATDREAGSVRKGIDAQVAPRPDVVEPGCGPVHLAPVDPLDPQQQVEAQQFRDAEPDLGLAVRVDVGGFHSHLGAAVDRTTEQLSTCVPRCLSTSDGILSGNSARISATSYWVSPNERMRCAVSVR